MSDKVNYVLQMDAILKSIEGTRPSLLLHACCGPCSSSILELLCEHFDVTVLYYNPNIWPPAEYRRRADEMARFIAEAKLRGVTLAEAEYDPQDFYEVAEALADEPEKGKRCSVCYHLRLERAAAYAQAHGFEWFTTTLSVSPMKDPQRINTMGKALEERYGVKFLTGEFRKRNGYLRSLELSRAFGLYRQAYCGCEYSAKARGFDEISAAAAAMPHAAVKKCDE